MTDSLLYFKEGSVIAEVGDTRVYQYNGNLFLDVGPGHNLVTSDNELPDFMNQLNDKPVGSVLEVGLGLGTASRYILSLPKVRALTTIEANADIIEVNKLLKNMCVCQPDLYSEKKHQIYNIKGLAYVYTTKKKYDFVFLNFYNRIDDETLPEIADMVIGARRVLSKNGRIMGWFDPYTPEEYVERFNQIFRIGG